MPSTPPGQHKSTKEIRFTEFSKRPDIFRNLNLKKKTINETWLGCNIQIAQNDRRSSLLSENIFEPENNKKTAGATVQVTGVLHSTGTSEGVGLDQSGQFVHIVIAQIDAGVVHGT